VPFRYIAESPAALAFNAADIEDAGEYDNSDTYGPLAKSQDALAKSMQSGHGGATGHAAAALQHGQDGEHDEARDAHLRAAAMHDRARRKARAGNKSKLADAHMEALMAHRDAADSHDGLCANSRRRNGPIPRQPSSVHFNYTEGPLMLLNQHAFDEAPGSQVEGSGFDNSGGDKFTAERYGAAPKLKKGGSGKGVKKPQPPIDELGVEPEEPDFFDGRVLGRVKRGQQGWAASGQEDDHSAERLMDFSLPVKADRKTGFSQPVSVGKRKLTAIEKKDTIRGNAPPVDLISYGASPALLKLAAANGGRVQRLSGPAS